jgi:hypothetical protein
MARSLFLPVAALLLLALAVSAYPDTTDGEDNGVSPTLTQVVDEEPPTDGEPKPEYPEEKPVYKTKSYGKGWDMESYNSYKSSPKSYKNGPYGGYGYTSVSPCVCVGSPCLPVSTTNARMPASCAQHHQPCVYSGITCWCAMLLCSCTPAHVQPRASDSSSGCACRLTVPLPPSHPQHPRCMHRCLMSASSLRVPPPWRMPSS